MMNDFGRGEGPLGGVGTGTWALERTGAAGAVQLCVLSPGWKVCAALISMPRTFPVGGGKWVTPISAPAPLA